MICLLVAKPSKGGDAKLKGLKITTRKPDDQCQPVTGIRVLATL